jgi:hypothetical protein
MMLFVIQLAPRYANFWGTHKVATESLDRQYCYGF